MTTSKLADQESRQQALDVSRSFIVQAPAGSGKTELLTQRYLSLLAVCEQPEQVLAITFTRKAASEMRSRILNSLNDARAHRDAGTSPTEDYKREQFEIALAALKRDEQCDWRLLDNPGRLRVQTIDSFCFYLARQLPILSRIGGNPNVSEDVEQCFRHAVTSTLALLETDSELAEDIERLLLHLDNDLGRVEKLLASLLANRDQWLPYVMEISGSFENAKNYLQLALEELITESLAAVAEELLPLEQELVSLCNFAAENLQADDKLLIADYQIMTELPGIEYEAIPYWLLLSNLFITKDGSWRKQVTVRDGFPPGNKGDSEHIALCKSMKGRLLALLKQFRDEENQELLEALLYLKLLPNPAYEQQQWLFLSALTRILAHLSGQLLVAFRQFRIIDYTQTGAAARSALGSEEEPTDLALALDHQIHHILVDEFQDTSRLQLEILEQLSQGWQPGEARSLFLVGDPMQSVYGFRNANVGIYLNVQEHGVGSLQLTPLTLQTNFRSQSRIVDWVNETFNASFPSHSDSSRGAVPYSASVAHHDQLEQHDVRVELIAHDGDDRRAALRLEADRVVQRVSELRQQDPEGSIAILVRSRSHLVPIIPRLRDAGIQWQATDIDKLEELPVIEDLLSLTRALLNSGDRLAWLAILRAPWCGCSSGELHTISQQAGEMSIWSALQNISALDLTDPAKERLAAFIQIMDFAMTMRYRRSLRQLVEASWTLLRGSCNTDSEVDHESVAHYLSLLSKHEVAGGLINLAEFEQQVRSSFTPSRTIAEDDHGVHLLTMHKAKGLQFDHVLLPSLSSRPRSDDKDLLQWYERSNQQGEQRLFIAALSETGADDDMLYKLLRHEDRIKRSLEDTRLLYIAVTRARKSVGLYGIMQRNSKGVPATNKSSLLNKIWSQLEDRVPLLDFESLASQQSGQQGGQGADDNAPVFPLITPIRRFSEPLRLEEQEIQQLHSQLQSDENPDEEKDNDTYILDDDSLASLAGTLIHECLESAVEWGKNSSVDSHIEKLRNYWSLELARHSRDESEIANTLDFITDSVSKSLGNEQYAWVFDATLQDSSCELQLSETRDGSLHHYAVDRTFIDGDGVRWIVDYKTAAPDTSQNQEEFIATQMELHRAQLENYRRLMTGIEGAQAREVKTAIFFTSIPTLVELD